MSRELLQQVLDDAIDECYADTVDGRLLVEKIRAEIATDTHRFQRNNDEFYIRGELAAALKCWHRLSGEEASELVDFVAALRNELAKPERKPMTLDEIKELFIKEYPRESAEIEIGELEGIFARSTYRKFVNDLRAVEAFHGIIARESE